MTTMTTDLQTEFDALSERAREAANAYYNGPEPIMPDDEYDAIIDRMNALSAQHNLNVADTPLETVGAEVEEGSEEHSIPMLSLAKVTTDEELTSFLLGLRSKRVIVQPKLDGVSMSLEYTNGELTRAVTRGDGRRGEDVTHIVRHLDTVPTPLSEPFTGVVRGEVVIHKAELSSKFKNARNAVSGCLNYKTKKPLTARDENCRFYAFDVYAEGIGNSEIGSLNLSNLGFNCPIESVFADAHSVVAHVANVIEARDTLPYLIDGVVIKVCDYETRETMGNRSNSPRWAVAYKPASETAVTRLNGVTWQTGKGGTVTPVAELEPVDLAGVTISRASLHNMAQVIKLGIKIGDEVLVKRANDVIPQVVGVAVANIDGEQIDPPYDCPTCYFKLEQQGNSQQVVCPNLNCKAQLAGKLEKWASRDAADIDAIGPSWIEVFFEKGLVTGPADFYSLTRADLIGLPRMGEGNVTRFLNSIQSSKSCGMRRALIGLAIPMLGEGTALRLCRVFDSVEAVQNATAQQLATVEDIGTVAAESIARWMQDPTIVKTIHRLRERGVNLDRLDEDVPTVATEGPLVGVRVAITGTLWMGRDAIVKLIEAAGGQFDKSVTNSTDLLIIADPNSQTTKAKAARAKGVRLVGPEEAQQLLGIA